MRSGPTGTVRIDELARRAGCTLTDRAGDAITPTSGDCQTTNGKSIQIAAFTDHAKRDAWVTFVTATGYPVEKRDLWAVGGEDKAAVTAAADAILG
ncbi:hypothetical protein [Pseudofrankia inefficax]|uniref:hypothetical protein n=1 Tax=Pseudofrankia inefficax (strain DSM 45817 / CECT 9037 / DDB 130130 / EuI1c) TaxID=298654 RepID=UPI0001BFA00F|nr:hypothetical protein [Pseudofrankia inefficax]